MFGMQNKLRENWKNYLRNEAGQMAVITAMVGLPLILFVGYALDINNAVGKKSHISAALDTAALAAVIPDNMDDEERAAYAQEVFDNNYFGNVPATLEIDATRERVDIFGEANVPTFFGGVIGMDNITVTEKSAAILTKSDVVCVLALDPTGERAIEFSERAQFNASACSVQANSSHQLAMSADSVYRPTAKSFCTTGVSRGDFDPFVKHSCTPIEDPYKNLQIPAPGSSCDANRQVVIEGPGNTTVAVRESQLASTVNGDSIIPTGATLSPGIYCRGIQITGADVTLEPGVYHVWGDLEFTSFANVTGEDVTLILKGTSNRLMIRDGAQVDLKAPSTGLTAGLVFWQTHLDFWSYVMGRGTPQPNGASAISEISSGGGLNITGTAYFPNHELVITSSSPVASQSPATSFIAYRIKFAGRSNTQVHVDHEKGGIPPMLPRSDEGARLVSADKHRPIDDDDDDD